ncbi:hypothetical protein [Umezawaea beigongshangensis]|uniref:hypothetical protein n=1 Tax=Umezawaea beigongshangensis TaxID=2780383 RepID=UPI0018F22C66|nr:hypothetical protein [Umezawaea beigongshangensis]
MSVEEGGVEEGGVEKGGVHGCRVEQTRAVAEFRPTHHRSRVARAVPRPCPEAPGVPLPPHLTTRSST